MAFEGPGAKTPGASPMSRARGREPSCPATTPSMPIPPLAISTTSQAARIDSSFPGVTPGESA